MNLRFIGKNESMGLKYGEVYDVHTESDRLCIWVMVNRIGEPNFICPYFSLQSLVADWQDPRQAFCDDLDEDYRAYSGLLEED